MSELKKNVFWCKFNHGDQHYHVAATDLGLCYIGSEGQTFQELTAWCDQHIPNASYIENEQQLLPYTQELSAYLDGRRVAFTVPLMLYGTPFQLAVWNALRAVQYGTTCSYSDIAASLNRKEAVRAVATAIGANPVLIAVPCHRVIGKNGSLTGYRGGLPMKKRLLALEDKYRFHLV